jgi:hypothetical protein
MFSISVQLKVKFRAFGITFSTVEKFWNISYSGSSIGFTELSNVTPPLSAKTVYNDRGILLRVW